ncbi:hypothetical protein LWC08_09140 [Desulfobaculum bizertense]|uniref:hypothetical protein n=1 Tax=Desulfobaculum bizertense TaxID=376490 RepID=UPI001F4722D8|nr:hypothetical protein [Desulfobaculum bizertense]UIJ36904.1 hypothetical protein LWC08_09140 [Desulfobaculum bizertense]
MDWEKEETLKCEDGNYRCVFHAPKEDKDKFSEMNKGEEERKYKFLKLLYKKIGRDSEFKKCNLRGLVCPYEIRCSLDTRINLWDKIDISASKIESFFVLESDDSKPFAVQEIDARSITGGGVLKIELDEIVELFVSIKDSTSFHLCVQTVKKINFRRSMSADDVVLEFDKCEVIELNTVKCKRLSVWGEIDSELRFVDCESKSKADFSINKWRGKGIFIQCNFVSGVDFSGSQVVGEIELNSLESGGEINIKGMVADTKKIKLRNCGEDVISRIVFTSIEVKYLYFDNCGFPDFFRWESGAADKIKQKIDCYRALKAQAISEQNQPLVSRWHRKEWEMRLNEIREKRPRTFWASLEWLYSFVSGFGEDACRAGLVLLGLTGVLLFLSGVLAFFDNPTRGLQTTGEYFLQCLPIFSVAPPVGTEYSTMGKVFFWFAKLLLSFQTGMLTFALRNKFRRQ